MSSYEDFVRDKWMGDFDKTNAAIATLGLTGEAGEVLEKLVAGVLLDVSASKVAEKVKKHLRGDPKHNPTEHKDIYARNMEIGKELGDVLFYLTWVAQYHGLTLEEVKQMNIDKLEGRLARNGTLRGDGDNR